MLCAGWKPAQARPPGQYHAGTSETQNLAQQADRECGQAAQRTSGSAYTGRNSWLARPAGSWPERSGRWSLRTTDSVNGSSGVGSAAMAGVHTDVNCVPAGRSRHLSPTQHDTQQRVSQRPQEGGKQKAHRIACVAHQLCLRRAHLAVVRNDHAVVVGCAGNPNNKQHSKSVHQPGWLRRSKGDNGGNAAATHAPVASWQSPATLSSCAFPRTAS